MQPTTDQIAHYMLCKGVSANTRYTIYHGPDGLAHTTGSHTPPPEGCAELVRLQTDDQPPQSMGDMVFLLTYESQWTFSISTKNGPATIELSQGPNPPKTAE